MSEQTQHNRASQKISVIHPSHGSALVVTRSGIRVSELEYQTQQDAQEELNHWNRILTMWPDGTQVSLTEVRTKQ